MKNFFSRPKGLLVIFISIISYTVTSAQSWHAVGIEGFSAGNAWWTDIAFNNSGTPFVVYRDFANGSKATVMTFNGTAWVPVGAVGCSLDSANCTSIAVDPAGTPYIVFQDYHLGNEIEVMKYDGTDWVLVGGAPVSTSATAYTAIAIDAAGTPYIVYKQSGLVVMKFNGAAWAQVGTSVSVGDAYFPTIAINASGAPYVAYQDDNESGNLTVRKFDGTDWVNVGSAGFSDGVAVWPDIKISTSGVPYVAYMDEAHGDNATVKKFDGTAWTTVGTDGFSHVTNYVRLAIDSGGTPYVMCDEADPVPMKFNGTTWVSIGDSSFNPTADYGVIAIGGNNTLYAVFEDYNHAGKVTVLKLDTSSTTAVNNIDIAASVFSISPNPNNGAFTIKLTSPSNEDVQATITNVLGEKVAGLSMPANKEKQINVDVPSGMYFITAISATGKQNATLVVQ